MRALRRFWSVRVSVTVLSLPELPDLKKQQKKKDSEEGRAALHCSWTKCRGWEEVTWPHRNWRGKPCFWFSVYTQASGFVTCICQPCLLTNEGLCGSKLNWHTQNSSWKNVTTTKKKQKLKVWSNNQLLVTHKSLKGSSMRSSCFKSMSSHAMSVVKSKFTATTVLQHQTKIQTSVFNFSRMLKKRICLHNHVTQQLLRSSRPNNVFCLPVVQILLSNLHIFVRVWKWKKSTGDKFRNSVTVLQLQQAYKSQSSYSPDDPREDSYTKSGLWDKYSKLHTDTAETSKPDKQKQLEWITQMCVLLNVHSSCRTRQA